MMKLAVCILIATVLLGLVACSDNSGPLDSSQEEGLENITWILDSYGEQDDLQSVLEGTEITVAFEENGGVVRGSAGCNDYGGEYHIKKDTLTIPDLMVTEQECSEPEGIMEHEKQFLRILLDSENYESTSRKLRITADTRALTFISSGYTANAINGASLEYSCDAFLENNHINLSFSPEMEMGESLSVTLCSNPTTGYRWSEFAVISDPTVLEQVDHVYTPPEVENVVGAAGKDTWIFKELKKGMTNISLEYSQPWEGGEKGHWTFSFTVVAK